MDISIEDLEVLKELHRVLSYFLHFASGLNYTSTEKQNGMDSSIEDLEALKELNETSF